MLEFGNVKIFADQIEGQSFAQLKEMSYYKIFGNNPIRIMPDVHSGKGCVIGFTAQIADKIVPNIIGVDIGCGVLAVKLGKIDIDYEKLDQFINEKIPSGRAVNEKEDGWTVDLVDNFLSCSESLKNREHLYRSLGTLGGGNHFIEIDQDIEGNKYLLVHTGSRNLGKQVAEIYQDLAVKTIRRTEHEQANKLVDLMKSLGRHKEINAFLDTYRTHFTVPAELAWLEGESAASYIADMQVCQLFAKINRQVIASQIIYFLTGRNIVDFENIESVHNYIDKNNIVRKGAIDASLGKKVVIPLNMRDGCILGLGLGNEDWNNSAPHGAGRVMSRGQARRELNLEEFQDQMKGIYTTSICTETLDESPMVYKDYNEILSWLPETVSITDKLFTVYNFKAKD